MTSAGTTVLLWKTVFSCVRRGTKFTARVGKLAERISVPSEDYRTITHKEARAKLAAARKAKQSGKYIKKPAKNKHDGWRTSQKPMHTASRIKNGSKS